MNNWYMEHKIIIKAQSVKIFKYFLLSFLFIPPEMIDIIPRYSNLDKGITVISFLIGAVYIMFSIKNNRRMISGMRFLLALIILMGWLFFVNLIVGDSIGLVRNFVAMIRVTGYCSLILNSFQQNEDDYFICGSFFYCLIIMILNVSSQLYFGSKGIFYDKYITGWQPIYVCGNANRFAFFFVFTFCLSLCYVIHGKKKILTIFPVIALIVYSSFASLSDMAKIVSILMLVCVVIYDSFIFSLVGKHRKLILLLAGCGAFWMIGLSGWMNKYIITLVEYITDKRSFIIRGSLWHSTIEYTLKSPIVGYGTSAYRIAQNIHGEFQSAHNTYLQIMAFGGIPALALFIIITVIPFKIHYLGTKVQYYISLCVFLYLLVYLFEQNPFYPGYYALLALLAGETIYHPSEQYIKKKEKMRIILWK